MVTRLLRQHFAVQVDGVARMVTNRRPRARARRRARRDVLRSGRRDARDEWIARRLWLRRL